MNHDHEPMRRVAGVMLLGKWLTGIIAASFLVSPALAGPVTIAIPHQRLKERGRTLSFDANYFSRAGNGSGFQAGGAFVGAVTAKGGRHLFLLRANADYSKFLDTITSSGTFAHARHQYRLIPWLLTDAFVQFQQDRFQRLRGRTLVGGGPAFWLYESDRIMLRAGTGIMHEGESYRIVEPSSADAVRSTSYLALTAHVGERASLSLSAFVQPRINAWSDYRVLNEATLTVGVNSWLATTLGFVIRHDSAPPLGVKKTDVEVSHSIGVTL